MKTSVYIDGFNLYYGSLKNSAYRWLDIASLAQKLASADQIVQVRYFTARIKPRAGRNGQLHQQVYLRALATLPNVSVHFGHFLSSKVQMPLVHPPATGSKSAYVVKLEEKGSDVNLATHLLVDAFNADIEKAIVVSNDSDLCEPISLVISKFGIPVGVYNPHRLPSQALMKVATFVRPLRTGVISSSQLPNALTDSTGTITKPSGW
jgi:uncharacterized LabA/DUF88 family protein